MVTDGVPAPSKLSLSIGGDNQQEWKLFKQRFELYLLASEKNSKPEEAKVALLLTCGGNELLQIYNSFEFPAAASSSSLDPAKVLKTVLDKFDAYFAPRRNELASRYKFRKCLQSADESIDTYITRLKILVKDCNYEDQRDKELRDQIVFGCADDKLRQKFFEQEDLTLQKATDVSVAYQAARRQMDIYKEVDPHKKEATAKEKQNFENEVSGKRKPKTSPKSGYTESNNSDDNSNSAKASDSLRKCKYCGRIHVQRTDRSALNVEGLIIFPLSV